MNGLGGLNDDDLEGEPPVPFTGFQIGRRAGVPANAKRLTNPVRHYFESVQQVHYSYRATVGVHHRRPIPRTTKACQTISKGRPR